MKRILLFTVFSLQLMCGAQVTFPTVREAYDFAAGDTFQYRRWNTSGTNLAYCRVILSRTDYANDSIVYLAKTIYPTFTDTTRLNIGMLDSAAYWQRLVSSWEILSTSISVYAGDTAYAAQAEAVRNRLCHYTTNTYHSLANYRCGIGFGETYIFISDSTISGACNFSWCDSLVYLHKTNGQVAGTPDSSFFTGIDKISYQSRVILSPNPAVNFVTLETAGNLPQQTSFMLYDLTGRVVLQQPLTETTSRVELSGVSKGMYLYNVVAPNQRLDSGKLVID